MRLQDLAQSLDLRELTPAPETTTAREDIDVTRGYASDLLSDILARAPAGEILVTLQTQPNIATVAGMSGVRAVIFTCGRVPDDELIQKAAEEGLTLYVTSADTFEVVGRLYSLGVRGHTVAGSEGSNRGLRERVGREEASPAFSNQGLPEGAGLAPVWARNLADASSGNEG